MCLPIEKPRDKGEVRNRVGIMLGLVDRSDEVVIGTLERVVKARTAHRMLARQRGARYAKSIIFQGSNGIKIYNIGAHNEESANAEIDDEHIRNALALPLFQQESGAEVSLKQTYHSNAEGLFKGAQSILAITGRPVVWQTQKRESSQELDDDRIRIILETQKGQLLADAKSEILKHENKADPAKNHIRGLMGQIESQDLDFRCTLGRHAQSRQEQDLLHEKLADRERALRDSRSRGIHEMEALKRTHELRVDDFSKGN